jgi:hypothetical protein
MAARHIVAIGIDPGLTGAVAALSLTPRRLAVRSAIGVDGYYRGVSSGRLPIATALAVVRSVLDDVDGNACEVWACVEQPGLWKGRQEGARRISRVSADQRTWRNAVELTAAVVLPDWPAQKVDRRAGLRRQTVGRDGRKREVAAYNRLQVDAGVLPPFDDVPHGCRVPSDGIHDAVLIALAVLRTANGGSI